MTDDEIEQLISTLEDLLRELNLDPIVAQERVLATEGEVKTGDDLGERAGAMQAERSYQAEALPRYDIAGTPRREIQKRFRFANDDVRVTPLGARARLRNLLDLVEVATAGTLAMERIVHDEVASLLSGGVVFVDPPESELRGVRQEPWTLSVDSDFHTATTHAENVVALLDSLRAQVGVERSQELARRSNDSTEDIWALKQGRP